MKEETPVEKFLMDHLGVMYVAVVITLFLQSFACLGILILLFR